MYHAIDPHIGRPAAIRTIQPGTLRKSEEQDDCANASFAKGALGRYSHPGVVTIYDVDRQGDLAYIAMEYADGPTLDEVPEAWPRFCMSALLSSTNRMLRLM